MKIGREGKSEKRLSGAIWGILLLITLSVGVILGYNDVVQSMQDTLDDADQLFDLGRGESTLPTLIIDMPFANYNDTILRQRSEALESGMYIGPEEDFANADVRLGGEQIPVRLRLRQGPATHLGDDDKWNLQVRTRDDRLLMGMQRFYLIDPADNNWLNEWAFMKALRREGLLAPRYRFVNLIFNGENWGIYAVQEGFGAELMSAQGKPEGVIVEFDARHLWESLRHFEGDAAAAVADPVTNLSTTDFQFFEVDTFRDETIADDEALSAQKDTAIGLLRGLQSGELTAEQVFDVEVYGRFLAVVDLWGALDAASLVNLRYYYNPESGRLQPIGFNGNPLLGNGRVSLATATYGDAQIQAAYSEAAARLSRPDYLVELRTALEPEWQRLQRAVRSEHDSTPPWDALAARQQKMRLSLAPLQPVFAYLGPPSLTMSATIQVDVANVLNLPVEIIGFDIDGATFLEAERDWLQAGGEALLSQQEEIVLRAVSPEQNYIHFARFHLPLTEIVRVDDELDFMQDPEISVATRIVGQERPHLTPARPGYPDPLLNRAQTDE